MSLYIPTWEEKKKAKELRADIFEVVTEIRNPKDLKNLRAVARAISVDKYKEEPLSLNEFVEQLDLPMVIRIKDLFKDEEPWLTTKKQIDELCTRCIDSYMSPESCDANE